MEKLITLIEYINSKFIFNEKNYPLLKGNLTEEKAVFILKNIILNIQKSLGKLATECESFDHFYNFQHVNQIILREETVKLLINTLKLSHELGFSAETLLKAVLDIMSDEHAKLL